MMATKAPVFATLDVGPGQLQVMPDGRWRLTLGQEELIRDVRLVVPATAWKGAGDQRQAQIGAGYPERDGGAIVVKGEILEPVSGTWWKFTEELRAAGDCLRAVYEVHALVATPAGEISLFLDLPIESWRGRPVLLWPTCGGTFPETQPDERHFLTGGARALVFGAGERPQVSLRLTSSHYCTVQDTREWKGDIYQAYVRLHTGGQVRAGERLRLEFELRPDDTTAFAVGAVSFASQGPLAIRKVARSAKVVPRFGLVMINADVAATFDTPFDPDQVAVDAHFSTPGGGELTVPAFFSQDYERTTEGDLGLLEPKGAPAWQVRFAPMEVGQYRFYLTARDRSGSVRSTEESFQCVASDSPGFVRVSKSDPRYFEFDNGQPYFAVGENMAVYQTGLGDFERWLGRLGAAGANYTRVWMCSPRFGIEWGKPGTYRLNRAWQLDRVMELAERHGVYVKLCLESWRGFSGRGSLVQASDLHPYWKKNGGPCEKEIEAFTHPEAKRMFRNRLRYMVARWGYSTHLMAWEFWNEINCVRGYDAQTVANWTQEMARYVKSIDPWRHLVVNSLGSFLVDERYWRLPEMDFAQVHGYWHPTAKESHESGKDMGQFVPSWIQKLRPFGKPCLFAEFGLVNERWGPSPLADKDAEGVHLHNGLWSAMMSGAAGTAMLWWWDSYVDPQNLYWQFRNVAAFARGVPWTTAGFEPVGGESSDPHLRVLGLRGRKLVLLWLQNKQHTWWNVVNGVKVPEIPEGTARVAGVANGSWQAEWWDTWQGKAIRSETVTVVGNNLALTVKQLTRDVAVKLKHME